MVHPQPDFAGAATHTLLGMFIIFGAIFFLGEKWHDFPDDLYESWNIVLAGGLYLFASSLLIKYEEAPIVMHHGYHMACHRGAPVTLACLIVAGFSFGILCWFGLVPKWLTQRCLRRIEVFHEDPCGACCQGRGGVGEGVESGGGGGGSGGSGGSGSGGCGQSSVSERSYGEGDSLVPKIEGSSGGSSSSGRYARTSQVELV